jgi:hypothetical protein
MRPHTNPKVTPKRLALCFCALFACLSLLAAHAPPALAADAYYVAVFAAQDGDLAFSRSTHNFAVFARMDRSLLSSERPAAAEEVEAVTISWLPASLPICITCTEPVAGHNYGLRETFLIEERAGLRVSQWGPFEVGRGLFEAARAQRDRLTSGLARYVVWDRDTRPHAVNCIHAITDADASKPPLATGPLLGDKAGEAIVRHFWSHVIATPGRGSRFRSLLGIGDLPVVDR